MSIFSRFFKKTPGSSKAASPLSGLKSADETVPLNASDIAKAIQSHVPVNGGGATRRNERLERREMLYAVVRETMTRVGVLSVSYRFKVLSLDSRGRQYLIMMDLVRLQGSELGRLTEIETLISQTAKVRHDIVVSSVYWRINETVGSQAVASPTPKPSVPEPHATSKPAAKPRFDALQEDEVEAFKRALSTPVGGVQLSSPGEIVHASPDTGYPDTTFVDTELDDRPSPLGGTQYGELR
ncbi:hypothetical protein [Rhodoferax aquaticus]|uniref:Uncharacterized protein n=1 Tax=Rhodoferax aquaticus TaxID=2527691 RepID=A0A515EVC9_9BURK|nr:hypothetical protein [Rhodoferax aquaticus]QDL56579.1 hypothetical protein EXZ61_21810 [Rhodoferax aquaticus]